MASRFYSGEMHKGRRHWIVRLCGAVMPKHETHKTRRGTGLHSHFEAVDCRLHLVVIEHFVSGADVRRLEPLAPIIPS